MIYLDHAASSPLLPSVRKAIRAYLDQDGPGGNASSAHAAGRRAADSVEQARQQVAGLIGADPGELIWTSGATEANNLAIKGAIEFNASSECHVVTSRIEHRCVLDTCRWLESAARDPVRVTYLQPMRNGVIDPQAVLDALTPKTLLVSLMWVNNEIGTLTDIEQLAQMLSDRGVMLHVDAAQAVGKIPIDLSKTPISMMSVSAHKFGGPQGVGALFLRRRPRVRVAAQMHGGGHEQGMRSGTLPVHQIIGMGAACEAVARDLSTGAQHMQAMRNRLASALLALDGVRRNGVASSAAPHILNLSFEGVHGESLRAGLPQLAVSSGSACSSATAEPSYVLRALGCDDELANASLRFSFSAQTRVDEIDQAARQVIEQVQRLRALSPGEINEADV